MKLERKGSFIVKNEKVVIEVDYFFYWLNKRGMLGKYMEFAYNAHAKNDFMDYLGILAEIYPEHLILSFLPEIESNQEMKSLHNEWTEHLESLKSVIIERGMVYVEYDGEGTRYLTQIGFGWDVITYIDKDGEGCDSCVGQFVFDGELVEGKDSFIRKANKFEAEILSDNIDCLISEDEVDFTDNGLIRGLIENDELE